MPSNFHVVMLAALVSSVGIARADEISGTLKPGVAVERRLTAGESHAYTADLIAGKRWLLTVDQHGIDVVLAAMAPDAATVTVDAPTYRQGIESLLLPPSTSGTVRVEVRSESTAVGPGAYQIAIQELDDATHDDRRRLAAEAAMTEAGRFNHQKTVEARQQAVAKYYEALTEWRRLEEQHQEARVLVSFGTLLLRADEARRALDAYSVALPLLQTQGERRLEAIALSNAGLAHWKLGDNGSARARLDQAMALQRSLGNRYGEAVTLNNLCLRFQSRGELTEAQDCYLRALELVRELGELKLESTLLANVGSVYNNLGEPRRALDHHRRALALRQAVGDRPGEARSLSSIAVVYRRLGEMQEALTRYGRALEIFREVNDRRGEAVTLTNIGVAYRFLGEPQRALAYLKQALSLRRELADRRGESVTLNVLGQVQARLGDYEQAIRFHRQALDLRRALGDRRGESHSLNLLGQSLNESGDPAAAIDLFDQAILILQELKDRRGTATALYSKGTSHLAAGEPRQALPDLSRALELHRELENSHGEAQTLYVLARAERQLGRREAAREYVEAALEVIESLRTRVSDPGLRSTFLASQGAAYELTIDLLMEFHAAAPEQGFARRALETSERARARSLLDLLNETGEVGQGIDASLRERRAALLERLNAKANRRLHLIARARDQQAAELELYSVVAELESVEAEIHTRSPYQAALAHPRSLAFDQIQALLTPGTMILEIALGEERSFLWSLTTDTFDVYQLPGRETLETLAREAHRQLATLDVRAASVRDDALAELGRLLLGPIADRLSDQRLVVVADGALHYIPFAVLPVPEPESDRQGRRDPLVLRHEIVHLPSASALALQRKHLDRRSPAPQRVAVFADPVFDAKDPRLGARPDSSLSGTTPAAPQALRSMPTVTRGGSPTGTPPPELRFDRLPSTRREARSIASLAPPGEAWLALDFSASRSLALGGDLNRYRIVHFATHGLIDSSRPELSGLVLSRVDSTGAPRDGFLRLRDIYSLELSADLVVLSGCRTAWGREIRGEGLVGLTRGFMAAGVPRVIASLWRVEDRATAELMAELYRSMWQQEHSPAAALRQAQLSVIRQKKWRDPYYWGAFIVQGDWR